MINRPTIIEFDCGNEYNGQGVIANTWPEHIIRRWSDFVKRANIVGYVARTDRYGDTRIVGTPNEILLYALKKSTDDQSLSVDDIYRSFISEKYGEKSVRFLMPAFKTAYDIITSSLYTLGTNIANHSRLDYDPYKSSYGRHVSGKWIDPPIVRIGHKIDKEFHYWQDIIEHLAPARYKKPDEALLIEAPNVLANGWVTPEEKMDKTYLNYIIAEKRYGVKKAREALNLINKAKPVMRIDDYTQVYNLFYRTLLTARLYEAVSTAYFGFRIYARGQEFQRVWLNRSMKRALENIIIVSNEIENYGEKFPKGQWNWIEDASRAKEYYKKITQTGWKEYGDVVLKN